MSRLVVLLFFLEKKEKENRWDLLNLKFLLYSKFVKTNP